MCLAFGLMTLSQGSEWQSLAGDLVKEVPTPKEGSAPTQAGRADRNEGSVTQGGVADRVLTPCQRAPGDYARQGCPFPEVQVEPAKCYILTTNFIFLRTWTAILTIL